MIKIFFIKESDIEIIGEDDEFASSTKHISGSVIRIMNKDNVSVIENCKIYSKGYITYPIMFYQSKSLNIKNCYFENDGKAEQSYNLGIVKVKQSKSYERISLITVLQITFLYYRYQPMKFIN